MQFLLGWLSPTLGPSALVIIFGPFWEVFCFFLFNLESILNLTDP